MPTFGEKLQALRESKGMSQTELAAAMRISAWTLRNHEQSRRGIASEDLFRYCEALGVPCTEFKGCVKKQAALSTAVKKPKPKGKK